MKHWKKLIANGILLVTMLVLSSCESNSPNVMSPSLTLQERIFSEREFTFETTQNWMERMASIYVEIGLSRLDVSINGGQSSMQYRKPLYLNELGTEAEVRFMGGVSFRRGQYVFYPGPEELEAFVGRLREVIEGWPLNDRDSGTYPMPAPLLVRTQEDFDAIFSADKEGSYFWQHEDGSLLEVRKSINEGVYQFVIEVSGP